MNIDAPDKSSDQVSEQQVDWQTMVYRNAERAAKDEASRGSASFRPVASPAILSLESSGALPVLRTSC